ncbi:hypothetical protein LOK49_LG07G00403 [Camellia lanceoleosa]|uniref:Uncharacterized protein n=1 Tax=Camellia lanceoleosa TaxID=1840588 RepID=A0ACC0GXI1_9ERIC|nr:hypothetical protein LOK49_LG07G00403 [Camellia lanceoleosa]
MGVLRMVEVRVPNLDCEGCAAKLRKSISQLKEVEEIEIDMETKDNSERLRHREKEGSQINQACRQSNRAMAIPRRLLSFHFILQVPFSHCQPLLL